MVPNTSLICLLSIHNQIQILELRFDCHCCVTCVEAYRALDMYMSSLSMDGFFFFFFFKEY